jgi:hypothetical protein
MVSHTAKNFYLGVFEMLKLIDLIELAGVKLHNFKIHCATPNENEPWLETPLNAFIGGKFKQWQEDQNQKNFECEQILSLINLEKDQWLFAGIYVVDERAKSKSTGGYRYSTHEVSGLKDLVGKAIIQFRKTFRQSYLLGPNWKDQLFVSELKSQRMTYGDFPGYKSVLLSYKMLQTIIREPNSSWHAALSNVGGVYLITDTSDGKLYVGSAYGGEGIWQRWTAYAQNGHGGNKEIIKLLSEKGNHHAEHFQFSLLEICDLDSGQEHITEREGHWKMVLKTREFGLNN